MSQCDSSDNATTCYTNICEIEISRGGLERSRKYGERGLHAIKSHLLYSVLLQLHNIVLCMKPAGRPFHQRQMMNNVMKCDQSPVQNAQWGAS